MSVKTLLPVLLIVLALFSNYGVCFRGLRSQRRLHAVPSTFSRCISTRLSGQSGAALDLQEVSISIGNNDIISDINWSIMPKERWALVGRNGAGKSTLLRALTKTGGEMVSVREGRVALAPRARLGYLEQKGVSGSTKTVRDEVTSRMDRYTAASEELTAAEKALEDGDTSDEAIERLTAAAEEFEAAGGYTIDQKVANVLKGLGFLEEDYDKFCSEFSGGWQMRIALARLLLSEPDVLILDEPTNHLDKGARDWLGSYLANYDSTLLIVSHDVKLLQTAVQSIAEVRAGTVELYKSRSHDQWQIERDERVKAAQVAYEKNQEEIARLQGFVDRFGAKTMGASAAQSRLKMIEKLEASGPKAPVVGDGPSPSLKLPEPPRGSQTLMEIKGGTVSWEDTPIVSGVNLKIERGMRIAVRGPNGAGKTTLLSALSGKLPLSAGQRVLGDGLELGVFTQDLAQDLDQTKTGVEVVLDYVRPKIPSVSDERARGVLGALGLMQEKSVRLVGHLSGGEKARVALASFVLIPHNLLLLDEPSNHLDLTTLKVLTKGLRDFSGTTIVISHDREFLEELNPTHVLTVRGGGAKLEARGLRESDWNDDLMARVETKYAPAAQSINTGVSEASKAAVKAAAGSTQTSAPSKPKGGNIPRQMKKLEDKIEKYEKKLGKIDDDMIANGTNTEKLLDLQKERDDVQGKVDTLYTEYEELLALCD